MFQQDYLMRLIFQFIEGMRRSIERGQIDPKDAADSLEGLLTDVLEFDSDMLLSLGPESFASILQVSGTDPHLVEYVVRSLALDAYYRSQAGEADLAELRYQQAEALADAYGVIAPVRGEIPCSIEDLDALVEGESLDDFEL